MLREIGNAGFVGGNHFFVALDGDAEILDQSIAECIDPTIDN